MSALYAAISPNSGSVGAMGTASKAEVVGIAFLGWRCAVMEARRFCGDVGVLDGGGGVEKEVVAGENGMLIVGGPVRVLTCCF